MAIPTETIRALTGQLKNLSPQDATFARSLITSVEGRGFCTEKQEFWLTKMLAKANGEPDTKVEAVGDLARVYAMFETAKTHLKKPAIVLGYERNGRDGELKIYVAGERSSTPGALQVKDLDGTWWGRVHQNGNFEQSRRDPPPFTVVDILKRFSLDPVGEAARHGHLTGRCCFCNRHLEDERSTAVGYGPTCAGHFGLAWGSKAQGSPLTADPVAEDNDGPDPEDAAERQALDRAELYLDRDQREPADFDRWAGMLGGQ